MRTMRTYKINNYESTHYIRYCIGCQADMVTKRGMHSKRVSKICPDCKEKLTEEEIKALYKEKLKHKNDQLYAKWGHKKSDVNTKIFNSPFRKQVEQ